MKFTPTQPNLWVAEGSVLPLTISRKEIDLCSHYRVGLPNGSHSPNFPSYRLAVLWAAAFEAGYIYE